MSAEHGTTPESVKREIKDILDSPYGSRALEGLMREAASNLEFEEAARLRDEIKRMRFSRSLSAAWKLEPVKGLACSLTPGAVSLSRARLS